MVEPRATLFLYWIFDKEGKMAQFPDSFGRLMNTLRDLPPIRNIREVSEAVQSPTTVMQLPKVGNMPRLRLERRYALTTEQPKSYGGRVLGTTIALGALTALWITW